MKKHSLDKESFFLVHRTGADSILLFIQGSFQRFNLKQFNRLAGLTFSIADIDYHCNIDTIVAL